MAFKYLNLPLPPPHSLFESYYFLEFIAENCHWFAGWQMLRAPVLMFPLTVSVNSASNYHSWPNDRLHLCVLWEEVDGTGYIVLEGLIELVVTALLDLGHNREHFFLCGIIKAGMYYSQTAKDITEEKIFVVDSICNQRFFTHSLTQ